MWEWDTSLSWSGEGNRLYKFQSGADDDIDDDGDDVVVVVDDVVVVDELEEVNKQCCLLQGVPKTSLYMKL